MRPPTNPGVDRRSPPAPADAGRLQAAAGWWQPEALSVRDTQKPLLLKNGEPRSRRQVRPRNQVSSTTWKPSFAWLTEKQAGKQGSPIRTSSPESPTTCGQPQSCGLGEPGKKGILDPPFWHHHHWLRVQQGTSYPLTGGKESDTFQNMCIFNAER